jgi:hypothetical protein
MRSVSPALSLSLIFASSFMISPSKICIKIHFYLKRKNIFNFTENDVNLLFWNALTILEPSLDLFDCCVLIKIVLNWRVLSHVLNLDQHCRCFIKNFAWDFFLGLSFCKENLFCLLFYWMSNTLYIREGSLILIIKKNISLYHSCKILIDSLWLFSTSLYNIIFTE